MSSPRSLGLELLDKLKGAIKDRIAREHAAMSRQKLKRGLLDQLDGHAQVRAAPDAGRGGVQERLERGRVRSASSQSRTFDDEGTTEEKAREEYRAIAERRVRLGLVLAEIGEKNNIKVSDDEISARDRRARPPISWPRAGSLGFLPQESRRGRERPGADLRGQGRRLPGRARQRHREAGVARGPLQGRGRGDRRCVAPYGRHGPRSRAASVRIVG